MNMLALPRDPRNATRDERRGLRMAYRMLKQASADACKRGLSPITQPVSLERLGGVSFHALALWMHFHGHVQHVSVSAPRHKGAARRRAKGATSAGITSGLALTESGLAFAGKLLRTAKSRAALPLKMGRLTPRYDKHNYPRVLSWGTHVLMRFSKPAANQELILAAAEEQGWPAVFDDPLPRGGIKNPKARRHDTIKFLNRHQEPRLVHFKGDGSGTGIVWELLLRGTTIIT